LPACCGIGSLAFRVSLPRKRLLQLDRRERIKVRRALPDGFFIPVFKIKSTAHAPGMRLGKEKKGG
jgi:hypothetical protein